MKVLNAYVYRHIRPDKNEVFYVGIGCYQKWQKDINRQAQLGRKHSPETIELRVSQFRKKVLNTVTGEIFSSIKDLAQKIGKSPAQTTRRIKSGQHHLKFVTCV